MSWCSTCGEWAYTFHTCPPEWLVWCPEDGDAFDSVRPIRATDAAGAAEKWAERSDYDSAEYTILRGGEVIVHVVDPQRKQPERRFRVRGEAEPVYYADELEDATGETLAPPTVPSPPMSEEVTS